MMNSYYILFTQKQEQSMEPEIVTFSANETVAIEEEIDELIKKRVMLIVIMRLGPIMFQKVFTRPKHTDHSK